MKSGTATATKRCSCFFEEIGAWKDAAAAAAAPRASTIILDSIYLNPSKPNYYHKPFRFTRNLMRMGRKLWGVQKYKYE